MSFPYLNAAELEDQIAVAAGLRGAASPGVRPAQYGAQQQAPATLIAGIDVTQGVVLTAYGTIPLDPVALSMVVGICSKAMRDHLEQQLENLNANLGVANVAAQAEAARRALAGARNGTAPPMPQHLPEATQGHAEGEDGPQTVRLTAEEAAQFCPRPARRKKA